LLRRAGFEPETAFVVLDADAAPGGAWQHRWPSLRFGTAHRIYQLPGLPLPAVDQTAPAAQVVADYFAAYQARFALPVHRPVRVSAVRRAGDDRLLVQTTLSSRTATNSTRRGASVPSC
jgi:cation diffusion facilitator CzcD-associated flavoprotein CzcO